MCSSDLILTALVLVIIGLLFQQLNRRDDNLDKQSLHVGTLEDDLGRKEEQAQKIASEKELLQKKIDVSEIGRASCRERV